MELRDYQHEGLDAIASAFLDRGVWRQLLVWATGLGKTVGITHLHLHKRIAHWLAMFPPTHRKMLVMAHLEELLDQAAAKFKTANPRLKVGIEQADRHADLDCDVVIASIATLHARQGRRLAKFDLEQFRIVVCDESHRAAADSYRKALTTLEFLPPDDFMPPADKYPTPEAALDYQRERLAAWDKYIGEPTKLLLGVTATPNRADGVGLEAVFQEIVHTVPIRRGIEEGYLSCIRAIRVDTNVVLDSVHTRGGDFDLLELADAIDTEERTRIVVDAYQRYAVGRKKTVAFCVNVDHAQNVAAAMRRAGIKAECIHGNVPTTERKAIFDRFTNGDTAVLTNVAIVIEGIDIPMIDCIIHARPTKSQLFFTQASGRGLRLAPAKTDCLIIDVVDVTSRHSLVTTPAIFGLPAGFNIEGQDVLDVVRKVEAIKASNPYAPVDGSSNIKELEMHAKEVDLFGMRRELEEAGAQLSWTRHRDETFSIKFSGEFGKEEVVVFERNGAWKYGHKKLGRICVMGETADSGAALRGAEKWLLTHDKTAYNSCRRDAPWKRQPATAAQLYELDRLGVKARDGITKGEANTLINLYSTDQRRLWVKPRKTA